MNEERYMETYRSEPNEIPLHDYKPGVQTIGRFPTFIDTQAGDGDYDTNVPNGNRFPTLSILTELQLKFGRDCKDQENAEPPPQPFPSRRKKEELFSAEKYEDDDKTAVSDSMKPLPGDRWEDLSRRLFVKSGKNLDKVRAAFCFACHNWGLPTKKTESEAYRNIRLNRHIKVFQMLLQCAKVPAVRIKGYLKSADTEPGQTHERLNGIWHACYVAGEWRFVDVHWGSGSVSGFDSGRYRDIDILQESSSESRGEARTGRNEFFFLTDPEKLAVSHFPVEVTSLSSESLQLSLKSEDWQLLCKPLTKQEFEQMLHYFDGSEQVMRHCYQLEPLNYPRNVIVARPQGPVEIFFKAPTDVEALKQLEFTAKVRIYGQSVNDVTTGAIQEARTDGQIVTVDRLGQSEDVVWVTFKPPCAGKFALTIELRRNHETSQHRFRFLTYIVHCSRLLEQEKPIHPPRSYSDRATSTAPSLAPEGPGAPIPLEKDNRIPLTVTRERLAELRSYPRPPTVVFNAVRAILLMLGFYQKRSRKWHRCQPLITAIPQAVEDLIVSSVDPRIAAKSRQLLNISDQTELTLKRVCPAAYEFYKWVKGTTELIEAATPRELFVPAKVELQKQIFRVTPEEDAHWDWEDRKLRRKLGHNFLGFCDICHVSVYSDDLKVHLHCRVSNRGRSGRHTART